MAAELVHLKDIEQLSPRVIRILGGNPSTYTLQGTNTYLIGHGRNRILLDTGEGKPAWLSSLKSVLASESANVDRVILTHWHHDHIQGVPDLLSLCPSAQIFKHMPAYNGDSKWTDFSNGAKFTTEGATLRALHSPGHTQDHMAFILEEENAMLAGDNVLGQGTAVFEDLKSYMESLEAMSREFRGRIYPGHGPIIEEGNATVAEYIEHRKEREKQTLDVLSSGNEARGNASKWTSMEIVKIIYKDYPQQYHQPAEGGVIQVLDKLQKEGRAKGEKGGLWEPRESSNL